MPVIRDPDFIDYGEYDVNSPPIDPYTASKNNAGQPAQLLIDYDDRKFALTAPKYGEIGAGNTNLVGYGGTGGVTGQALYSKFKQIWKTDNIAVKFPFPMEAITPESFEFINGWEPDDTTELDYFTTEGISTTSAITRKLIKDCGWAERTTVADGNAIKRKYFGIITLGAISRPFNDDNDARTDARIYCSQFPPGVGTNFATNAIIDADDRILVQGPSAGAADDAIVPDMWTGNSVVYQQPTSVNQGIGLTHNNLYFMRYEGNGPFSLDGARPGGDTVGVGTSGYRIALYNTLSAAISGDAAQKVPLTAGAGTSVGRIRNQSTAPNFFFNITEEGGAANEPFLFFLAQDAPLRTIYNYDNFFKIYCREKGRTYADQAISQVGVTQINYQAYRIPLATAADANLAVNNTEIKDKDVSDEGNETYAGIGISFFQNPETISINEKDYNFNCIIDANFKTLPSVYQKVQYLLRNPSKINTRVIDDGGTEVGFGFTSINSLSAVGGPADVGFGTVGAGTSYQNDLRYGNTEDLLLEFVGTNLFAKLRDDIYDETGPGETNYGIYIKDVQNDDLNRVFYFDNDGILRDEPFVSSFNLVFNTNLNEDNDARFWVFFDKDSGSTAEPLAGLSTDTLIDQIGEHNVADGINPTENQIEFGSPREHHPFVNGQQVVAISTVSNPGIGITCEINQSGIATYQLAREGSTYYTFTVIPPDYAGKNISTTEQNPEIFAYGIDTIEIDLDTKGGGGAGHPFFIKEGNALVSGQFLGGSSGAISDARVLNNGSTTGIVTFNPDATQDGLSKSYYYICGDHPAMRGNITILDKLQDSPFVYYVNAINPNTGLGQTYVDVVENGDFPNVRGVGAAHSMKLHYTYLDAVANGGVGVNTIGLTTSLTNTGVVTFTQVDVNYEENNATIVRTSIKQAEVDGGPLAFLEGIDVPEGGEFGLTFDYDFNSQRNRQNGTDAKCKVISIGLEKGQFVSQDFTITRNKGVTVQVAGALERVYSDPT